LIEYGSKETFAFLPDDENELEKRTAIIHSSGSTGKPKGAVIRQSSFVRRWTEREITLPRVTVLLAPLNHIMGRINLMTVISAGGTGYFTLMPDMSTMLEDIRISRPTFLSLFPRIFEVIYQHFQNEALLQLPCISAFYQQTRGRKPDGPGICRDVEKGEAEDKKKSQGRPGKL